LFTGADPPFAEKIDTSPTQLRIFFQNAQHLRRTIMLRHHRPGSHILLGTLLILAGGILLLENQGILSIGPIWRFWPLILVGIGIANLVRADTREEQGSAIWLTLIGVWLEVSILHIWDLGFRDTWPALFIAIGISMLWKTLPAINHETSADEVRHVQ
jgi:hypothetical protein